MGSLLKQIEEQALGLKADERAKLAEAMLESLHAPVAEIEAAWAREVEQRVYRPDHDGIVVFAVVHHKRRPEYWAGRI